MRGLLAHARPSTAGRVLTNVNTLCEGYVRLTYQGQRTKGASGPVEITTAFAPSLAPVYQVAADVGRVLLKLFSSAFCALQQCQHTCT